MTLPGYLAAQISADTQYLRVARPFELENGELLDDVVIAYRTWGDIANARERAILVCHALTGSADVDAWWPGIIGEGSAFDPRRDFIVCANILGSCYGTTGPVSTKTGGGDRWRADFPRVSVRDMVTLQALLLDELGIDSLELVTGPSLGGMQALEWALSYPERVRSIVPIGVGGRHSAWCIGVSEAQRAAIAADPDWNDGYYSDDAPPERGLAAARMMAICTYRSWQSFDARFGRDRRDADHYQVQSYLQHQGSKINARFDANTYVTLTHAMHTHDLARNRGGLPGCLVFAGSTVTGRVGQFRCTLPAARAGIARRTHARCALRNPRIASRSRRVPDRDRKTRCTDRRFSCRTGRSYGTAARQRSC